LFEATQTISLYIQMTRSVRNARKKLKSSHDGEVRDLDHSQGFGHGQPFG
jgi:hypothetical protein